MSDIGPHLCLIDENELQVDIQLVDIDLGVLRPPSLDGLHEGGPERGRLDIGCFSWACRFPVVLCPLY